MRSARRGRSISEVEVTNVSEHGFWLLVEGRELFLPFEKFPWFSDAPVGKLMRVERPHPTHLHWPDLDVDLALESIEFPERFPLVSRIPPGAALRRPRAGRARRTRGAGGARRRASSR
jgi:Protein of unknown function (DUF2442)